ncbi:MAG: hypothetical protein J7502_03430 [Flavisolibacter sp.]|nr:hypothetical protein [Flavisolibacter sp.]
MITRAVPKLPFIEKQQTIEFYVNGLGFSLQSDYSDYFIISFSEAELHFFSYPGLERNQSDFMIYLRVNTEIDGLYETLQKNNIAIHPMVSWRISPGNKESSPSSILTAPCSLLDKR